MNTTGPDGSVGREDGFYDVLRLPDGNAAA
jgi:hypothetical protein